MAQVASALVEMPKTAESHSEGPELRLLSLKCFLYCKGKRKVTLNLSCLLLFSLLLELPGEMKWHHNLTHFCLQEKNRL